MVIMSIMVVCNDSDFTGYDRKRPELSVCLLHHSIGNKTPPV